MELKDLRRMTSVKLREEALKHPDITGVHGLNKEQLVEAMAKVYGIKIDEDKESAKPKDAGAIKQEIKQLKKQREEEITNQNKLELQKIRKKIKRLKRRTRALTK